MESFDAQLATAADPPAHAAVPPTDPPRELTSVVRRRAWTEPRVRLWWMLALGILVLTLCVAAQQTATWWSERQLLAHGVAVNGVIVEAQDALNDITVPNKSMPPDSECTIEFDIQGRSHSVKGVLPEHVERGRAVVTGPAHPIVLHVDPDDPDRRWTARTSTPPLGSRQLIGVAIGMPIIVVLALAAVVKQRRVADVWRGGRSSQALVLGTGQTPLAPRSRSVRCTSADTNDKRVFTVFVPPGPPRTPAVAAGDVLWVIRPADRAEPALAAAWFDRGMNGNPPTDEAVASTSAR